MVEGSLHVLEADTVIFAIGQSPEVGCFPEIETNTKGNIAIDEVTLATNRHGVFAAGDVVNGSTSVIDAIASGKRAATSIHYFLQGLILRKNEAHRSINAFEIEVKLPSDMKKQYRQPLQILPVSKRKPSNEVHLGFSKEAAFAEARRCLNCAGHLCREVCPYHVPQFGCEDNPRMQMCNLCVDRWARNKKPICVASCPTRALDAGPIEELRATYGDIKEAEMFTFSKSICPSIIFKPRSRAAI